MKMTHDWKDRLLAGQELGVGAKAGREPVLVIRLTWAHLVFLFFLFVLLGAYALRSRPLPELVAGTDMFWEVYEQRFGCDPCPTEAEAIRQLRAKGYRVEESQAGEAVWVNL